MPMSWTPGFRADIELRTVEFNKRGFFPNIAPCQCDVTDAKSVIFRGGGDSLKMTIMLVEDSRFLRVASERALIKAGYEVVCASDGEAAVLTAHERAPNLILLDMMLPKLDGLGVLRALKHNPQTANIPVIVLTGLGKQN